MMQKRILVIIILLASIGMVLVQSIWISGVYKCKRDEISVKVDEALANVVDKVWQEETITQIYSDNKSVLSDTQIDSAINSDKLIQDNASKLEDNVQDALMLKRYFVESVVEKMLIADIPIEQRVTIKQLDSLLINEFKRIGLQSTFQIAICDQNDTITVSSNDYEYKQKNTLYKRQLFPNDPWFTNVYFVKMYIENENNIIYTYILPYILSSIILTLVIFTIFIYATYIISRQKKISEIKNGFISNITHELKTPISTISLAAQMLGDENIPQEAKNIPRLSGMIKEQSKQLSFLVEKVLQTSVFERQTLTLNKQAVSLHAIIKEADDIMTLQLRNKKATLITELHANNDIVLTDKVYFVNVITNLLDNALKYSKEAPKIVIGTRNENKRIVCYVADNGIGIKTEDLDKIFEQFFRVHTGNVHNIKGFGLGLNYVKKIVELSSGYITVDSEIDQGTTFNIWLPLYDDK